MNQSVCYDINQITEWQNLIDMEIDNEDISNGIREQEQDVRQILFKSLIKNIPLEAILEVWFVRATGTQGICHYVLDNLSPILVCGTQTEDRVGMEKTNMQHELMNLLKSFIYDTYNKNVEIQETQETFTDINNPVITKHKGRLPKRFKFSVETLEKWVLKDSTKINMITDNVIVEEETNNTKGRKCGKCKQYGHYAKTYQNNC
ncbi:unnamed protein product [Rhizophagus irregularis]|nr:unnamed protein product [Rhizophagus irregularis]